MSKVLIIDDDHSFCSMLAEGVRRLGHDPTCAYNLHEGVALAHQGRYEVVYLDVWLPDGNGLDRINDIKGCPSSPEVIIATGQGDANGAELAMKVGAWDYMEKPSPIKAMTLPLVRALQYREAKGTRRDPSHIDRHGIVGNSRGLLACLELLDQAAGSNTSVLITGETGTGKELFARAIHANSPRSRGGDLVVVDCTALPETLVASLLFGHERGSFTGATQAHEGLIRQAHRGTLFLDEVGELPLELQKAFLRVLQERSFRPVGSGREEQSDFRLVAATNRNLDQMVEQKQFRKDLLYRLRSITIELPPLRERAEDIPHLALYYMTRLANESGQTAKGLAPEFFAALTEHDWPGNVRELFNTLERAVAAAGDEPVLYPKHLPTEIRVRLARQSLNGGQGRKAPEPEKHRPAAPAPAPPAEPALEPALDGDGSLPPWKEYKEIALAQVGRVYLQRVMEYCQGDVNQAQEITGLSRARLYALMKSFKLPRRRWVRRQ